MERGHPQTFMLGGRPRSANVKALNRVHAHAAQVLARVMVGRMDDADRRMTSQVGTSGPKLPALLLLDLATMIGRARETERLPSDKGRT